MEQKRTEPSPLVDRIASTFTSPARLVAGIRGSAPWLDVLLISTAIAVLGVLTLPDELFLQPLREAMTRRGRPVEITSSPEEVARWGRYLAMLAALGTHPVIAFVVAAVITFTFTVAGRGSGTFRDYLSLTSHGLLIPAAGTLLAAVLRVSGLGAGEIRLGALLPRTEPPNLSVAWLSEIDPFLLWMFVVLGLCAHHLDPKHSRTVAPLVLVAGYLLFALATAAIILP